MALNKKIVSGYGHEFTYLSDELEFIKYFNLKTKQLEAVEHVCILAGHYQVIFDEFNKNLVPMIPEEYSTDSDLYFKSKLFASAYPVRSFKFGLDIILYLKTENKRANILLLVNDKNLKKGSYSEEITNIEEIPDLRKNYYHQENAIPKVFLNICKQKKLNPAQVFLVNQEAQKSKAGILPKETIFFSEQVLMRRFKTYTLRKRIEEKKFVVTENEGSKNVYYHSGSPYSSDYCVLGAKQSTCISVAIELISLIIESGSSQIILAIPNDCVAPINEAAEIVLSLYQKKVTIFVLSNMESPNTHLQLKCTTHRFVPNHEKQLPAYPP
jgi:hypothetical protein